MTSTTSLRWLRVVWVSLVCVAAGSAGCTCGGTPPAGDLSSPFSVRAGTNAEICPGGSVTLGPEQADPSVRYSWSPADGLSSATDARPVASPAATTVYTLTAVEAATARVATASVTVTVRTPPPAITGPDTAVCAGGSITLGGPADPSLKYQWEPADGLSAVDGAQPVATPAQSTRYTLTVTDANGCTAQGAVQVGVNALPQARITALSGGDAPARACAGSVWSITGAGSTAAAPATVASYAWSLDDGQSSSAAAPQLQVNGETPHTATLTVTDSLGCQSSTSAQVTPLPTPAANAGPDLLMGEGGRVSLAGSVTGGTPPYALAWTSSEADCTGTPCLSDPSVLSPSVSPSSSASFALTVTDANGCATTDLAQVTVTAPVSVSPGPDVGICLGDSITIGAAANGGAPPYAYAWSSDVTCSSPGCLSDPTAATPTVSPTSTTTFTELAADQAAGSANGSVTVTVSPDPGTAGADLFLFPGSSAVIGPTALPQATYAWTCDRADCALSNASSANPVVAPLLSTRYDLSANSGPGCTKATSATVWIALQGQSVPQAGATAYPASGKLEVYFDHPIAASRLTPTAVILQDATTQASIPVTVQPDSTGRLLMVTPPVPGSSGYAVGSDYTLVIAGGSSGVISDDPVLPNLLPSDLQVDFTTAAADTTAPGLSFRSPGVSASFVPLNATVEATFNEPVDPNSVTGATVQLLTGGLPVDATVSFDFASNTVLLRPSADLAPTTTYTVQITGVRDLSANAASFNWTFSTGSIPDTTPPTVSSVNPADGATGVSASAPVSVVFSEQVDTTSLGAFKLIKVSDGTVVGGTVTYNSTTLTATFAPSTILAGSTAYQVSVSGVRDLAQNAMAATFTSSFTTAVMLFRDDFESGTARWSLPPAVGSGVPWGLTTAASVSPTHSLTDSPNGKYGNNVDSIAQLAAPLSLGGASQVWVEFAMRTRLEKSRDVAYVEYQLDNGAWVQLGNPATGSGWTGNTGWTRYSLTIPTSGASTFNLRFRMVTNSSKTFDGVYVDDVLVQHP